MSVLVNIFLRGICMTLKMSVLEILHTVSQHWVNLNVHLCILKGLFTSHPICWFLCYWHPSVLKFQCHRLKREAIWECFWREFAFSLCKEWYLCAFNLLFFSWWLSFLKHGLVFVGNFIIEKSSNIFTCVYLILCLLGFSFRGLSNNYVTFNNSSNNYILDFLSRVHATILDFFP